MSVVANPNAPTSPPVMLKPGWYWYQWPPSDKAIWAMVVRVHADVLRVKREYVSVEDKWGMAVFYLRGPLEWRMRGKPSKAPRGAETKWEDVLPPQVEPRGYTEHYWEHADAAWESVKGELGEVAGAALDKVGSAANFLLWGGVAVLLVNTWRSTSPSRR